MQASVFSLADYSHSPAAEVLDDMVMRDDAANAGFRIRHVGSIVRWLPSQVNASGNVVSCTGARGIGAMVGQFEPVVVARDWAN